MSVTRDWLRWLSARPDLVNPSTPLTAVVVRFRARLAKAFAETLTLPPDFLAWRAVETAPAGSSRAAGNPATESCAATEALTPDDVGRAAEALRQNTPHWTETPRGFRALLERALAEDAGGSALPPSDRGIEGARPLPPASEEALDLLATGSAPEEIGDERWSTFNQRFNGLIYGRTRDGST